MNPEDSASTGSVVAFHGETTYGDRDAEIVTFFEVADCHCKARLHKIKIDSMEDFINKIRLIEKEAGDFANFLEKEYNPSVEADGQKDARRSL